MHATALVFLTSLKMNHGMDYFRLDPAFAFGDVLKTSNEKNAWNRPTKHYVSSQNGPVSHLEFCKENPSLLAVTSSTRVVVYNANLTGQYTYGKFKDKAYCGTFRSDGNLLAAGGEDGLVQVFNPESFGMLRTFRGHLKPVHCVSFKGNTSSVFSGGDDGTLRSWDVATGVSIACSDGAHDDYIRALATINELSLCATGSYDHHCKIWDSRSKFSIPSAKFKHNAPVEAISFSSSGNILVSAAGTHVYYWDLTANRLMRSIPLHQKTITSVIISSAQHNKSTLLISGSLDGFVKISDFEDCRLLSGLRYSSPVLSCDLASDGHALGVGMSDGMLSVKQRRRESHAISNKELRRERLFANSHDYFIRGKNLKAQSSDFLVERRSKKKLREYDSFLKGFRFKEALQAAVKTKRADILFGCVDTLLSRGHLMSAVSGLNDSFLISIVETAKDFIADPNYSQTILTFLNMLLEEASKSREFCLNKDVLCKLKVLHDKIRSECQVQDAFLVLRGMIDPLLQ